MTAHDLHVAHAHQEHLRAEAAQRRLLDDIAPASLLERIASALREAFAAPAPTSSALR